MTTKDEALRAARDVLRAELRDRSRGDPSGDFGGLTTEEIETILSLIEWQPIAEAKLKEAAEHIRSVLDDAEDLLRMAKIDPPDYPGSYIAARAFLASLDKGGDHDR